MRADHHDLVGLVAARNLADDVESVQVGVVELVVDVHLQRDGDLLLERPPDASVMLDCQRDLRRCLRLLRVPRSAALHEQRAAVAPARVQDCGHAFIEPELRAPGRERLVCAAPAAPAEASAARGLLRQVDELGVRVAVARRLHVWRHLSHRRRQHELTAQRAAERAVRLYRRKVRANRRRLNAAARK